MIIDPISAGATGITPALNLSATASPGNVSFSSWLTQNIADVNSNLINADEGLRKLALGTSDNLHQVMINMEKARLSFELMVQVRNKLLDGYQQLMQMQI